MIVFFGGNLDSSVNPALCGLQNLVLCTRALCRGDATLVASRVFLDAPPKTKDTRVLTDLFKEALSFVGAEITEEEEYK